MTKVVISKTLSFKEEYKDDIDKNNILVKAESNIEQAVLDNYIVNVFDFEIQNDYVGETLCEEFCPICNSKIELIDDNYDISIGSHFEYLCKKCKIIIHVQESPIITNIEPVDDEDNKE